MEVTEPVFPDKNPKTQSHQELTIEQNETWFCHKNLTELPVPFVSFGTIKSTSSIIPPAREQFDLQALSGHDIRQIHYQLVLTLRLC